MMECLKMGRLLMMEKQEGTQLEEQPELVESKLLEDLN